MQKLPKLNKVAVDNEPEPKPKQERDIVPCYIIFVALLSRLILSCCGVPAPMITSWISWWIAFVVMILAGEIVRYLAKQYNNEGITAKIEKYYVCTFLSLWGLLTLHGYVLTVMFIVLIIFETSHLFQFLLIRKK